MASLSFGRFPSVFGTVSPAEPGAYLSASRRADRAWGRVLAVGVLIAVLFHLVVLLAFRTTRVVPPSPFAAAGPDAGDIRAAAGGAGLEMVAIRVQQARPQEVTPTPVPVPESEPEVVVEPEVEPERPVREPASESAPQVLGAAAGTGGGEGTQAGPGKETGTGAGGGGTGDEGRSEIVPPVPRGMILPPTDRPRSVRGREVTVWVYVNERGRVVADQTRLEPPTPDAGYNRKLKRSAAEWVFEPARKDGKPVAAWYPFELIL